MRKAARSATLLAAAWAGVLACIAFMAAPAAFSSLSSADAGRYLGRLFAQEAPLSLAAALLLVFMERQRAGRAAEASGTSVFSPELMLLFGTVFCTVLGYYAVQPLMTAARLGQGGWSFGALHAVALAFFSFKSVLVVVLAWRLSRF